MPARPSGQVLIIRPRRGFDPAHDAEVRRALPPLVEFVAAVRCAVLGISRFTKGTAGRDPVERVTGSLALGTLARVVLATAKRSEEDGRGRMLARALLSQSDPPDDPERGSWPSMMPTIGWPTPSASAAWTENAQAARP
jgi:hypothetical protein